MAWTEYKRDDSMKSQGPFCSITKDRITFNNAFIKLANCENCKWVTIKVDEDNRRIGFIFLSQKSVNSMKLYEN